MMPNSMSESPWFSVALDVCDPFRSGETLLNLVDYYCYFPFVGTLKITTFANTILKLF